MIHLLPSSTAPFGPLQALHEHILRSARPITWSNAYQIVILPVSVLYVQAWLLLYPGTRLYRASVGVVGISLVVNAWFLHRFIEPEYNALNNLCGVAMLHLGAKMVEFACLIDPVTDGYTALGRPIWLSAHDLLVNSRWIGLRPIGMDPLRSETLRPATMASNGTAPFKGPSTIPDSSTASEDRWLPPPPKVKRTRLHATVRHLIWAAVFGHTLEMLFALLRTFGSDTVARLDVPPGAFDRFLDQKYILYPRTRFATPVHPIMVDAVTKASIGAGVWAMLSWGYHLTAALSVGTGLYEVDAWERDLYANPWMSTSLIDFWGRAWHQVFRHHFLLASGVATRILGLPERNALILPLSFLWSGFLHSLGELSMTTPPTPLALFGFFVYCGIGCSLEVGFRKLTGRRVQGVLGWTWKVVFLAVVSRQAVRAEMESGLGGSWLRSGFGPGEWVAGLVRRYIVDIA